LRGVIHHEFFHIIDYQDDGEVYRDDAWASLNPDGFRYGTGGKDMQDDHGAGVWDDSLRGVLNRYSTAGVEEDKAEIFAYMITAYQAVERRAANDPVLFAKTETMRDLVARFCSEAGPDFWDLVAERDAERIEGLSESVTRPDVPPASRPDDAE
jgi:hypothetical protein